MRFCVWDSRSYNVIKKRYSRPSRICSSISTIKSARVGTAQSTHTRQALSTHHRHRWQRQRVNAVRSMHWWKRRRESDRGWISRQLKVSSFFVIKIVNSTPVSLDNLTAIGKKEALMLTKEQIEMMLRINAPEVTLVQHIVRRPDLEKYWTYIRKINVNGHQTVWTQCTSK